VSLFDAYVNASARRHVRMTRYSRAPHGTSHAASPRRTSIVRRKRRSSASDRWRPTGRRLIKYFIALRSNATGPRAIVYYTIRASVTLMVSNIGPLTPYHARSASVRHTAGDVTDALQLRPVRQRC
jgi:hypothetical protein